jgi:hypothetical protein
MAKEEGFSELHSSCNGKNAIPWIRTDADGVAFATLFQVYCVGNGVEPVTIIRYAPMGM